MNDLDLVEVPPGQIALRVSVIANGRFYNAYTPMPVEQFRSEIPSTLQKERYMIRHSPPSNGNDVPENLVFRLGDHYSLDAQGRRHRQSIEREINLEAMRASAQQELEEQVRHELEHPDEQTAKALEVSEEEHQMSVAAEIGNQQFLSKEREAADQQAKALAEQDQIDVTDGLVTPAVEEIQIPEEPAPKPVRKMRKRFVNRNGTWLRVKRLKRFHVGENVFVKNADGQFQVIGQVNKNGKPPACYVEDQL